MSYNGRSYLNETLLRRLQGRQKRCLIGGGIASALFLLMIVMGFTSNPELKGYLPTYAVCLLLSLVPIVYALLSGRRLAAARRYESIFACDADGFISIDELKKRTGKDEWKILRELEALFGKGWFQRCALQREEKPGVLLTDAEAGDKGVGFLQVTCPHCGGANRLRAGAFGKCDFCGGPIRAKEGK